MSFFFDASTVAPSAPSTPIPAGVYLAHVVEAESKALQNGNGQSLKLQFEILDGQFKNRKVFENLNIQHTNPEAQRIAQSALSALCHAVGTIKITDEGMLKYKPVRIRVAIRPAKGEYAESNVIKGYEAANGAQMPIIATTNGTPAAPYAAPAAAPSNAPAWAKKA